LKETKRRDLKRKHKSHKNFIFQQDLAPAHAAKSTKDWFTKKQLEVLAWPANSPDLNVIENLWAIVKRKIRDRKPTTLDQLKQNIATAWETCDKLVKSMPRRLKAVIQAKGAATKYRESDDCNYNKNYSNSIKQQCHS
uniref:Tc1-like transposase DDE domain-containing protein n=1 Tax=Astyanax mexicanus TaxID=7994 RepID=A0A3B1JA95_ASTMX